MVGGLGGWDEYSEFIGIAHGKKDLPKQLYKTAIEAGETLAKKIQGICSFVDESNKKIKFKSS